MMTMIDLERDELQPVSVICQRLTSKRAAPQKVWRWTRRGCRGVKLEAVLLNGVWQTTPAAFAEFIRGQTDAALAAGVGDSDDAPGERSEATTRRLKAAGLL
jgi:hypothetical protein